MGQASNGRCWSFTGYLTGRDEHATRQREPLRRLSRTERAALQRIARSKSERLAAFDSDVKSKLSRDAV